MRIYSLLRFVIVAILVVFSNTSVATVWPDRAITFVVPYTPGTGIDVIARQLSAQLSPTLGQPIVVENVAGASGNIGSNRVARAKPDGYTFLVQVSTLVMNKSLYDTLSYDPTEDFVPVAQTSTGTLLLVTGLPNLGQSSVESTVAKLREAETEPLSYATPGVGTPHHLSMELFLQKTGTSMLHVPYKGTAGAITDLLGGRVDYMFLPVHVALPYIQTGKLKAIATGSSQRVPQLPETPTLHEAGIDIEDIDMWYGVLAPKGVSKDIINKFNQDISKALQGDEIKQAFETIGMVPNFLSPEQFAEKIKADEARWASVIKAGNISAN